MNTRLLAMLACMMLSACDKPGTGGSEAPPQNAVATGSVATGPKPPPAFAVCASCHAVSPGRSGVGPSLAGVFGRTAASRPGYAYSAPLKASGIVWDAKSLDQWLQGPMKMVPGTRMVMGLPNPEARKAVIDYMEAIR